MHTQTITFPSGNDTCHGTLRIPDSNQRGAAVILAHGFGGTADCDSLIYAAEQFCRHGLVSFAFDYRTFGRSGGEPRQNISVVMQREDYHAALACLRSLELVEPDRIGLWGTSFSGGHTLFVAQEDGRIAAAVAQVPALDLVRSSKQIHDHRTADETARMQAIPSSELVKLVIDQPGDVAVFMSEHSVDFRTVEAKNAKTWVNGVLSESLTSGDLAENDPNTKIDDVTIPTLVQVARHDELNSTPGSLDFAGRFDTITVRSYDCDHFGIYASPHKDHALRDSAAFFVEHLQGQLA